MRLIYTPGEDIASHAAVPVTRITPLIFILSPASTGGKRAELLFNERASFPLARRLRTPEGAPLGEVFSFLSGLYFRGKLAYASRFARPPRDVPGVYIITATRGLQLPEQPTTMARLREFAGVSIDTSNDAYRRPLERDAQLISAAVGPSCEAILLGSIATDKYVSALTTAFGSRLLFPAEFVGRGDMSRGGVMLRCVREERELTYVPVEGAARRGKRPERLERQTREHR